MGKQRVAATFLRTLIGLLLLTAVQAGCSTTDDKKARRQVTPADFAPAEPVAVEASAQAEPNPDDGAADGAVMPAGEIAVKAASPEEIVGQPFKMDAMVGQINGRAVYARSVFEPFETQLVRLGATLPRDEFKQEATKLIRGRLEEILFNELALGEAERDLNEEEQRGLQNFLKQYREEVLREFGLGSEERAEQELLRREGKTLEEKIDEQRQRVLISRYRHRKLTSKIHVTRKDIEKFYANNAEQFNPPATRTIRLIRAPDKFAAEQIKTFFDEGMTFAEAAGTPANLYRREEGGLFGEDVTGKEVFGIDALNEAMLKLKAGQSSPAIEANGAFWFVHVESIEQQESRPLVDVQQEIEEHLRSQRFQILSLEYQRKLREEGIYDSIAPMLKNLVEVAMNRYAQPA